MWKQTSPEPVTHSGSGLLPSPTAAVKKREPMIHEGEKPEGYLEAHADATWHMHGELWEHPSGVRVSTSTMSGAIRRVGWTRKNQNLDAKQLVGRV